LNRAFEEWRGPHEQVDDVLVVGMKFWSSWQLAEDSKQ
jgi:hypothetical protein